MNRSAALTASTALLAVVLTACTSSASKGHGTTTGGANTPTSGASATTSTASSTSTAPAPTSAQLSAAVLQASDLPAGWSGTPPTADTASDKAAQQELASCLGLPSPDAGQVAKVSSDDFAKGEATISSSATSYSAKSYVDQGVAAFTGPKAQDCFKAEFRKVLATSLPSGAKVDALNLNITPGSGGGPSDVVATAQVTVTATVSGQQATVYITATFIAHDRVGAEVDGENVGSPVDASVLQKAVAAVAQRVSALS